MPIINSAPLDEITGGDIDFRNALIETCIKLFEAFPAEFEEALKARDLEKLRFANHRIKANVQMIEASPVIQLLQDAQSRLAKGVLSDQEASGFSTQAQTLFGQMVRELRLSMQN